MLQTTRMLGSYKQKLMLPVPVKARRSVKATMEEILLQGDLQMLSRIQKAMNIIKESQGKNTSELHQGNLHLPGTKVYFLVISILVQILGTLQKIVGHISKTNIMVPANLLESTLQEVLMLPHS